MKEIKVSKLLIMAFIPPLITIILYIGALQFRHLVPPLFSFILIALFILAPLELVIILKENKKETGKAGVGCTLEYRHNINKWKAVLLVVALFLIAGFASKFVGELENTLVMPFVHKYIPDYFIVENFVNQLDLYSQPLIWLTVILFIITNSFVLPIIEELYFRGYMLPRLKRYKVFAPILVTVVFSLYHFWSPWQNIRRIVGILPYTYAVWKKENIYIGIIVHCLCNLVGSIEILMMVL